MSSNNIHIITGSRLNEYGGGVETWLDYFLSNLSRSNANIFVYSVENSKSAIVEKFKNYPNIEFHRTYVDKSRIKSFSYVKQTSKVLKKNVIDGDLCLLIGSIVEGALAIPLRKKYKKNIKICLWIRCLSLKAFTRGKKRILYPLLYIEEKINIHLSDKIITNGYDTFDFYKRKNKKAINKISVIPNAVEYEKFAQLDESTTSDKFKIIYIARLIRERFHGVCKIMSLFYMKYPEYRNTVLCDVWGDGNYIPDELPDNIKMKGVAERDIIPTLLQESNLYIYLLEEKAKRVAGGGLSHTLLEAMASGKLCVCTNHPAVVQIANEKNSLVVEPFDYEKIVDILYEVVKSYFSSNYERYKLISQKARLTAKKYSCEAHMKRFYSITHELGYFY